MRAANVAEKTAFNRTVTASPPEGGSGYSQNVMCKFFELVGIIVDKIILKI